MTSNKFLILLLGTMNEIRTITRIQKMAFLCDKILFKNTPHYTDWKPYFYGPYSEKLAEDIKYYESKDQRLIKGKLVEETFANIVTRYSLTIKGRSEFSKLLIDFTEQIKIKELLQVYQSHETNDKLLKFVYERYPEYTTNSVIKKKLFE
ncbi:MAG: hypothetical protein R1F52_06115 [Candidatus Nitrosoabyssus spongiisocia]|nr:MAG: hypothetical protein R1F52_06115 [Nitrosopumilaceae archaeon AB1(1)]